ncbi:two-component sensor histidine kinase [Lachnoclostridium sp. An196]|uniref:sensor histidine kinase n=1 Tax=Lachnoclostridium sp. An196 TaxID=1965583 RepID=UPI000B3A2458|nr:ATP-binding protein [Lachnoclostridium sp. An196]OUP18153.1 two-component sensor histidine kinase [Lachnoclostridium sp. An196]HIS06523.1 two-component sensor histidine kinase [Candidatus Choladocola avistercoris]
MKNKIQREFILVALSSILLTTVLVTAVFSGFFRNEILDELRTCARVIQSAGIFDGQEEVYTDVGADELRITLIDTDGTVIYDNDVAVGDLDNHGNRPEVELASEQGEGLAVRRSNTLDRDAFYYAVQQEDGTVLRVAKEASSVWDIFRSALPISLALALLILILCILLSARATKSLMAPITQLAEHLDEEETMPVYKEMIPFVNTIRKQHDDIMRNAKMRQDFTANVSHELKTPLTSISGYAELIEHNMVSQTDIPRFAGEIHRSATRLLTTINDIIKLSELDVMETTTLVLDRLPLYQMAENCVDMLQVNAEKHQVTLKLEGEPAYIMGNREMVDEVLYNLCDNAIRYNNINGSVVVRVKPEGEKVRLCVEDTGIGIPEKHQSRVFERFYRVDKSRSKATGGTGLGLAIVKHIVAQHEAEMKLESEPGKGTRITILFENADKDDTMN